MKESLFFIVMKGTDELIVDRAFSAQKDAEMYIKESLINKKRVDIKEAVYKIKENKNVCNKKRI